MRVRGSQTGLTWTELKSERGLGRQDGDGQTGTRAILATGRLTDVCLASEVDEWVSRADLWSNAVLASGEAVLLRRPGRLTSHLAC